MTKQTFDLVSAEKTTTAMSNLNAFIAEFEPKKMLEFIATNQAPPSQYRLEAIICSVLYLQRDAIRGQLRRSTARMQKSAAIKPTALLKGIRRRETARGHSGGGFRREHGQRIGLPDRPTLCGGNSGAKAGFSRGDSDE